MRSHSTSDCVMVIVDFDNFKTVNDTYGHQAGDAVLRSFGQILRHSIDYGTTLLDVLVAMNLLCFSRKKIRQKRLNV